MEFIEHNNHASLISFYSKRGIEELTDYPNAPILSYKVVDGDKLVGAATCSKVDGVYILEAIAIEEKYTGKGVGSALLNVVLQKLKEMGAKDIVINAKDTRFFVKNGFNIADRNDVPITAYSYCLNCGEYGKTCFPKIMKYKIEKDNL